MTLISNNVSNFESNLDEKNSKLIEQLGDMKKVQEETGTEMTKQVENMESISSNIQNFESNLEKTNQTFISSIDEVKKVQATEMTKQSENITNISDKVSNFEVTLGEDPNALFRYRTIKNGSYNE